MATMANGRVGPETTVLRLAINCQSLTIYQHHSYSYREIIKERKKGGKMKEGEESAAQQELPLVKYKTTC